MFGEVRLERGPEARVGGPVLEVEAAGHGAQVEPRPAHQEGVTAAAADRRQGGEGVALVGGDAERLVGDDEVEAVVRDGVALGAGRLGRPDVHPAVDLPRVGRDDLRLSHGQRQADRERGLAGCRRPADDDERRKRPVAARRVHDGIVTDRRGLAQGRSRTPDRGRPRGRLSRGACTIRAPRFAPRGRWPGHVRAVATSE